MKPPRMCRRAFIRLGVAGAGFATASQASGRDAIAMEEDPDTFSFIRLSMTSGRVDRAQLNADASLLEHISRVTNIRLSRRSFVERSFAIDDIPRLHVYPFLSMFAEREFNLTDAQASGLGEFFKRGGFLYADDTDCGEETLYFYNAFKREIKAVLGGAEMTPLAHSHELYHCFYDLPNGAPCYFTEDGRPWLNAKCPDLGLFYNNRLVCVLTGRNLARMLSRREPEHFDEAARMGTNIVVYALTH